MRHRSFALGLALTLATAFGRADGPAPAPGGVSNSGLADALRSHLAEPAFRHASWGLKVIDAGTGRVRFETNAHQLLKPASNAKLFTGALALDQLGPEFRFLTRFLPTGPLSPRGTLQGDLIVQGGGDFTFSARFHHGDFNASLRRAVEAIAQAGIRSIRGRLVLDDRLFRGAAYGTGWTWDDLQEYYGAEVNALSAEDNVVDVICVPPARVDGAIRVEIQPPTRQLTFDTRELAVVAAGGPASVEFQRLPGRSVVRLFGKLPVGGVPVTNAVSIPEPALFFGERLSAALEAAGIHVRGGIRHDEGAADRPAVRASSTRLAEFTTLSPPLRDMLPQMMKPSQNMYAQVLFLEAGRRLIGPTASPPSSLEALGIGALRVFLDKIGVARDEVLFDEGSGLSRGSLVTPNALVGLLQAMEHHPEHEVFLDSLPVAGVDGTLRNRLKNTRAEGNLRGKTGTLRYVHTLAGVVTNQTGSRLIFAAMLNAYQPGTNQPSGRAAVEEVARLLANSTDGAP
ncbi:MAG: D-alanyl-D-alanine carboxypeptidase/D-alanyl-D-alanine-endopeptidase [Verrucomicrobiales bacterium]|nr:D-alanyl-D-alanine carboxypeptidase/D-alanyl-D-alanine-endopeptidase [Verrucomicrobiales bacterium]